MRRDNISDLLVFLAVAQERSFTRAAAKLGVSPTALSHTIRTLETRVGVRLLTRTTRSVSPTEAGERLLQSAGPRIEAIESELAAISELRDKPAGTIRITTTDFAADTVLWPRLAPVLAAYPDIKIELSIDFVLTDIAANKFDIGVRWGDQIAKDMVAVRVGPDMRMGVVGSPAYLKSRPAPKGPQELLQHSCITLRLPTRGDIYAWELKKGKREVQARVDGQLTCNGVYQMLNAAVDGAGLAFVPAYLAEPHVAAGRLRWVLEDWSPTFPGLHIFYPSRREHSRAFALVIDALRYRA
ncbi:MAG: LysR family transcriptional regulator [Dechloromonas sp.]|jgi:DNA-binding transcriptional LysR family regulator|nr:LysR family transcriptional regulator [Candidatus Dechloromonas phosphoritropha]